MIQLLASRYSQHIAYCFFLLFVSSIAPVYGSARERSNFYPASSYADSGRRTHAPSGFNPPGIKVPSAYRANYTKAPIIIDAAAGFEKPDAIGGPSQPEMSAFKSAGTNDMVNLFTGDFSYNIPLMDVGGYPINIFYNGGIGMEQESSWVGLGWNINPGTVSRNMRGVPDDFNGTDTLTQMQSMKENKTFGASIGADLELVGIKSFAAFSGSVGASLGVSVNNYLGPSLELGLKGRTSFTLAEKSNAEKNASASIGVNAGLSANLSSRSGLTLSPNVSLTAKASRDDRSVSNGLSLSTSYNSRVGIKSLQLTDQVSVSRLDASREKNDPGATTSYSAPLYSNSISFAKPSYIPNLRMPVTNTAWSGRFQIGGALFGVYGSLEAEVYKQTAKVEPGDVTQLKKMAGYLYMEKGVNDPNIVMDFTRVNDGEVTPNTPIISAPQYSYDVFSIQGEGTGGSIRAYRNEPGYVRDNITRSKDKSISAGVDIGIPGHFGGNFNTVKTPSVIGEWTNGNKLRAIPKFNFSKVSGDSVESVYFRNPGETSVLVDSQFSMIGNTDLVRYRLGGTNSSPSIEPILDKFSKAGAPSGNVKMLTATIPLNRKKRSQVTTFLTAQEARYIGLDTVIKSYDRWNILDANKTLVYESFSRVGGIRKAHHISQVNVTEANGNRYIYGIPVYNVLQKDFTFNVTGAVTADDKVSYTAGEMTTVNENVNGYVQSTTTPGYASSYLLSGLLSPDYVDVTGNGITEDDLGTAVKFNYSRSKTGASFLNHNWRTPLSSGIEANFNAGKMTDQKDNKGIVSFGTREAWYMHSIESKNMIALFTVENRNDGKGATNENGGINSGDSSLKRLKKIDLYNKADLKKNGLALAKPIKTVWFAYSYTLCASTPDNLTGGGGKLTLDSIYFTYNGKPRVSKNKYAFAYGSGALANAPYLINSSDRWGTYKPKTANPGGLKNSEFPYSIQDKTQKSSIDQYAAAWSLRKILLPSGGQIEVDYETDDYAFVQNKRAAVMMEIAGLGKDSITMSNKLYGVSFTGGIASMTDNDYVFIKVPDPCTTKNEVFQKYLQGVSQLAFKLKVQMPAGDEYVNSYATIADYGKFDATRIWVRINKTDGYSPLALTALEFLREQLPGQAFKGYDVSDASGIQQIGEMLAGMLSGLAGAFKNPVEKLKSEGKAQTIVTANSFVRLNDPDGFKYGGGNRVKTVKLKNNWQAMTGQAGSENGQSYDYTTKEMFNGTLRTISSGVASYEPGIGGEENPFTTILQVANKLPLGPASYGAIEMPLLDAFFPAPVVGYSKVTVKSLKKAVSDTMRYRSGIGRQVTEFYTAKDFPVSYNYTSLDPSTDKQEHFKSGFDFFYHYNYDGRALSQGFIVETNDMHGKMKSQSSYAENDSSSRVNYTENFYRNVGDKGMNDRFDFLDKGGIIKAGNMGIDVELMTDTREFSVKSSSLEIQGQVDLFPVIFPFWLPFIWPVSGNSENIYRAVTATKVVSYHGILDSTIAIDKGSQVSTKNLVYDAETGNVLINRTNNEFDKATYSVTYPAYWAYSGMGQAYKNIDASFSGVNLLEGKIVSGNVSGTLLESGDEIYVTSPGTAIVGTCANLTTADSERVFWVFDKNKTNSSLTNAAPDLVFIDRKGKLFSKNGVSFRITRSGHRNMLDATVAGITTMSNPIGTGNPRLLSINGGTTINASAAEFREKWQTDDDVIQRYVALYDNATCTAYEALSCGGYLDKKVNPYVKGMLGSFRAYRNFVFYGDRAENNFTTPTNISQNGYLTNFAPYWNFNSNKDLIPDLASTKWIWNTQVTKVNSKSLELETKDALNIYTGAQYGFNKSIPVAITNNSRASEMLNESFEDINYAESLNGATMNTCPKIVDFTNIGGAGTIINMDSAAVKAHTGKYALAITSGNVVAQTIPIVSSIPEDYSMIYNQKDSVKFLADYGQNFQLIQRYPINSVGPTEPYYTSSAGTTNTNLSVQFSPTDSLVSNGKMHRIDIQYDFWMQPTATGSFPVVLNFNGTDVSEHFLATLIIRDPAGNGSGTAPFVNCFKYYSYSQPCNNESQIFNVPYNFCQGQIYKVSLRLTADYSCINNQYPYPFDCSQISHYDQFSLSTPFPRLKSLNGSLGCISTKPLAATDSMLNARFSIPAARKMVFSGWVKETCPDPCIKSSYADNKVVMVYNDAANTKDTIKLSGPIIDGWQRCEGTFQPPATASTVSMQLFNTTSGTVYFDDLRIHPFNANMKTYVYDPVTLRLVSGLDENNYAQFYEYDEEGTLVRTKVETKEGVKTLKETRSFKQRKIKDLQP